ncbi:uncharacterized protein LOC131428171 [Malaya genurostris]|uniref:uncharacterized protein LOC131428171 n=1 Tax=Malaya genurostris TaxID=325434 RepID=UPI0026F3C941|nr:uncharacterized protein LOC131428171 [Malaya genurostris]
MNNLVRVLNYATFLVLVCGSPLYYEKPTVVVNKVEFTDSGIVDLQRINNLLDFDTPERNVTEVSSVDVTENEIADIDSRVKNSKLLSTGPVSVISNAKKDLVNNVTMFESTEAFSVVPVGSIPSEQTTEVFSESTTVKEVISVPNSAAKYTETTINPTTEMVTVTESSITEQNLSKLASDDTTTVTSSSEEIDIAEKITTTEITKISDAEITTTTENDFLGGSPTTTEASAIKSEDIVGEVTEYSSTTFSAEATELIHDITITTTTPEIRNERIAPVTDAAELTVLEISTTTETLSLLGNPTGKIYTMTSDTSSETGTTTEIITSVLTTDSASSYEDAMITAKESTTSHDTAIPDIFTETPKLFAHETVTVTNKNLAATTLRFPTASEEAKESIKGENMIELPITSTQLYDTTTSDESTTQNTIASTTETPISTNRVLTDENFTTTEAVTPFEGKSSEKTEITAKNFPSDSLETMLKSKSIDTMATTMKITSNEDDIIASDYTANVASTITGSLLETLPTTESTPTDSSTVTSSEDVTVRKQLVSTVLDTSTEVVLVDQTTTVSTLETTTNWYDTSSSEENTSTTEIDLPTYTNSSTTTKIVTADNRLTTTEANIEIWPTTNVLGITTAKASISVISDNTSLEETINSEARTTTEISVSTDSELSSGDEDTMTTTSLMTTDLETRTTLIPLADERITTTQVSPTSRLSNRGDTTAVEVSSAIASIATTTYRNPADSVVTEEPIDRRNMAAVTITTTSDENSDEYLVTSATETDSHISISTNRILTDEIPATTEIAEVITSKAANINKVEMLLKSSSADEENTATTEVTTSNGMNSISTTTLETGTSQETSTKTKTVAQITTIVSPNTTGSWYDSMTNEEIASTTEVDISTSTERHSDTRISAIDDTTAILENRNPHGSTITGNVTETVILETTTYAETKHATDYEVTTTVRASSLVVEAPESTGSGNTAVSITATTSRSIMTPVSSTIVTRTSSSTSGTTLVEKSARSAEVTPTVPAAANIPSSGFICIWLTVLLIMFRIAY